MFVGKPDESKGSGPVWRRGKDRDHFKVLPIPIKLPLTGLSNGSDSGTSSMRDVIENWTRRPPRPAADFVGEVFVVLWMRIWYNVTNICNGNKIYFAKELKISSNILNKGTVYHGNEIHSVRKWS